MKATVRLYDRGQVVIPEQVRNAMQLQKGDLLELEITQLKPITREVMEEMNERMKHLLKEQEKKDKEKLKWEAKRPH